MDEFSLSIVLDSIDDSDSPSIYISHIIKNQCTLTVEMPDDLIFDDLEDYL